MQTEHIGPVEHKIFIKLAFLSSSYFLSAGFWRNRTGFCLQLPAISNPDILVSYLTNECNDSTLLSKPPLSGIRSVENEDGYWNTCLRRGYPNVLACGFLLSRWIVLNLSLRLLEWSSGTFKILFHTIPLSRFFVRLIFRSKKADIRASKSSEK